MAELHSGQVLQLQLAGVHALSCPGKAVLAACPTAEHLVASAANSFVVIWDASSGQQVKQLRSTTSNNPLQCVAWSFCGTHIAAGEAGNSAAVHIFHTGSGQCVQELKGHKHTVCKLSFSPDGKLLASTGSGLDGHLCIWDWHTGALLCKQKVATDLGSVSFTEDSSHILAVGKGTVKSWSLTWTSPRPTRSRSSSSGGGSGDASNSTLSLTARQVSLKQERSSTFVDLCVAPSLAGQPTGSNGVYALTDKGTLLLLRSTGRTVDRSINLQVTEAFGLAAAPKLVACACSRGTVRLFSSKALSFKANLPYWNMEGNEVDSSSFADARGCTFGPGQLSESLLIVVYSNHEIVLWDVQNLAQIHPLRSVAAHTCYIRDVCTYNMSGMHSGLDPQLADMQGCATCAADGNIRFWGLPPTGGELLSLRSVRAGFHSTAACESKVQLRCMRISHDGQLLAAGDTAGNVHVYDMITLQHIATQEAHDLEVLCLDFSPPPDQAATAHHKSLSSTGGKGLAVSGSKDMLIHVYDTCHGFRLLETLDEHEAEVTAVRFTCGGKGLVSCGGDHTIIFRALGTRGGLCSAYGYKVALKETLPQHLLYDLVVDPLDGFVLTADLNGVLRQWDAASGRVLRTMQPEVGAGQVVRLCMDPGGAIAICCHSDGCLRLYDIKTGLLKWRAWGHASAVAAAAVTPDLNQLVSVGADGCIMLWTLPSDLSEQLQDSATCLAAAQQQLGSPMLLPLLRHNEHSSAGSVTCRPSASSAATCTGVAAPAPTCAVHVAHGASAASTPGSGGDVALSPTARRIREGRPLVSADRLPRWAQSPAAPLAAAQYQESGGGASKPRQEQQQQRRVSKWAAGHVASGTAIIDPSVKGVEPQAVLTSSGYAGTNTATDVLLCKAQQQQPVALPGHMHQGRLLIRQWSDGSIFNKQAAATALAALAAAPGAAPHEGKPDSQPSEQSHPPNLLPVPEQTDTGHSSPATSGPVAVVRDLFKAHFSSPHPAGHGCKAEENAAQDDCLVVQQDRQSFSSKFKKGRSSLSQICSSVHEQETLAHSTQETASASCSPGPADHTTGLTPQGSNLFRAVSCTSPDAGAMQQPPVALAAHQSRPATRSTGALANGPCSRDAPTPPAHSPEPSPRERRWRQGQMKPELAGMWERLENLQAQFVQQQQHQQQQQQHQQQARASPARPVRPKSSMDLASPTRERPSPARRRSDNSAGCQTPAAPGVVAPGQGVQHRQPYQQGHSCLEQQTRLQNSQAATALSTKSPHRKHCNPLTATAGSRAAMRQPSPHATGKPEWQGVKDTPACSPQAPCEDKQHSMAAKGTPAAEGRTTPVFGSRTLARSLQRRKSSAGGDAGPAPGPAADAQQSSSAVAVTEPAAAGLAQAASSNKALLAALFADDSSTPSPQASAARAVQVHVNAKHSSMIAEKESSAAVQAANNPCTAAGAASHLSKQCEAAGAVHTPNAPSAAAELAELLAWDSSPESAVISQSTAHMEQTTEALESPSFRQHAPVPASKPGDWTAAKQVNAALFDSISSPGSGCLPSHDSSPDKQQLLSPIAVPCSPQLSATCASSPCTRLQGGEAPRHPSSQRLRELSARMRASTECRVSIGTSIAARSPTAVAAVHASPAAALLTGQHRLTNTAGISAGGAAQESGNADAEGGLRSVSFNPLPARGSAEDAADTPKVDTIGAAFPAFTVYEQQQQRSRLPTEVAALPDKAGVTITPNGGHEVWPGWGAGGAWEVTPSPTTAAVPVKKMWGADAAGPRHAGVGISSHSTGGMDGPADGLHAAAGAAGTDDTCLPAEHSAASVRVESQYEVATCSDTYWVAQNPCYDMTPGDSAGRTRGQDNPPGVPASASFELSHSSNAHTRLTGGPGVAAQHTGPFKATDASTAAPGPTLAGAGARGSAAPSSYASAADMFAQASGGFSRRTSFASILSASSVAAASEQQAPATPASMGDSNLPSSQPSSAASSKAGTKRQGSSSSGGGRGFSRTMQSLSGSGAAQCSPGSEGSPSSGMLALLQRMKWSLPGRKSRSGTGGGGCMAPTAIEQQGSRDGGSGSTTAEDILLEVTSAAMSSACTTPVPDATGWCTLPSPAEGSSRPHTTAAHVVATVDNFKHSIQEMKQLLQQLQGLQLDADSTSALHRMLTPQRCPGDAAGVHCAGQPVPPQVDDQQRQDGAEMQQCSDGSRLSSPARTVPLHQQLQQEVLTCISELHIAVTGMPLS